MKIAKLEDMVKGWFIGNFEPTLFKTTDCEVAVKHYKKGDYEGKHYHKIATEYTCIISGKVKMNGIEYNAGDIVVMEPNEATDFEVLSDTATNVVVKMPGANNDKYNTNIEKFTLMNYGCAVCNNWEGSRKIIKNKVSVDGDGIHTMGKCRLNNNDVSASTTCSRLSKIKNIY